MKKFDWDEWRKTHRKESSDYIFAVHKKNIQEKDFIRGYCSLPIPRTPPSRARSLYKHLKITYGFFDKDRKFE